jgi:predicted Fe-S protein YdhL (DUF1289 family)
MCLGCGRTMDEISRWAAMNETERNRVLGELPARLKSRQNSNFITARK